MSSSLEANSSFSGLRRCRIFWWHPMPMDYRVPLFRLMGQRHEIKFFFMRRSPAYEIEGSLYSTSTSGRFGLRPNLLSKRDAHAIRTGVRTSDVFVTSFLGNVHSIWGLLCAKRFGKKVIVWEEVQRFPGTIKAHLRRIVYAAVARFVDAFFVLGEVQKQALQRLGVPATKIFVANESPGLDYAEVETKHIDLPFDDERPIFLFLGRFVTFKGIEYLLRAFALVERRAPLAALVIVGDGPLRESLVVLANELKLEAVHFTGFISDEQVKSYLFQRASALVVPSINTVDLSEGGPLVVLEALSAGLPVIGTDALGSSTDKIIEGVNGHVVPERDPVRLAERMLDLLGECSIDRHRVRETFLRLPGHAFQAAQLDRAIGHALGRDVDRRKARDAEAAS